MGSDFITGSKPDHLELRCAFRLKKKIKSRDSVINDHSKNPYLPVGPTTMLVGFRPYKGPQLTVSRYKNSLHWGKNGAPIFKMISVRWRHINSHFVSVICTTYGQITAYNNTYYSCMGIRTPFCHIQLRPIVILSFYIRVPHQALFLPN
jgi:hypothetical protein